VLVALIPEAVSKLIDLVGDLAGMGRRKRQAKFEVLKEVFVLLTEINSHYLALFAAARDACPTSAGKGRWTYRRSGRRVTLKTERGVRNALHHLKEDFLRTRALTDPQRILLRSKVAACLRAQFGDEEKRFVWAMSSYLLYPEERLPPTPNLRMIDVEIKAVEWRDSNRVLNTPSSRLFDRIEGLSDPEEIFEAIEEAEAQVKRHWAEVARFWADLELTIASKTP
jgi:hypothetical protein